MDLIHQEDDVRASKTKDRFKKLSNVSDRGKVLEEKDCTDWNISTQPL